VYRQELETLVRQVRTDLAAPEMILLIPRLSSRMRNGPDPEDVPEGLETVRAAQQAVAESVQPGAWIDTDDLDLLHERSYR
jgi:hypothetical protein